jgi:hypothetical protein
MVESQELWLDNCPNSSFINVIIAVVPTLEALYLFSLGSSAGLSLLGLTGPTV